MNESWRDFFFSPPEVCKHIRWRYCRKKHTRFRFHSASGQFWNPEVFLLYALHLRLTHTDSHTRYNCWILSVHSIYSHFHFLPSGNICKLWEDFLATSVPGNTFQVNLLRATSLVPGQLISKGILNGVSIPVFLCCGLCYTQGTLCCHFMLSSKTYFLRKKGSNC